MHRIATIGLLGPESAVGFRVFGVALGFMAQAASIVVAILAVMVVEVAIEGAAGTSSSRTTSTTSTSASTAAAAAAAAGLFVLTWSSSLHLEVINEVSMLSSPSEHLSQRWQDESL